MKCCGHLPLAIRKRPARDVPFEESDSGIFTDTPRVIDGCRPHRQHGATERKPSLSHGLSPRLAAHSHIQMAARNYAKIYWRRACA